jgi:16S rRNA (guanine527-N7)-methyltransferase
MTDIEPAELACDLFPDDEKLKRYVDILLGRGIDWGLIGPREAERVWERHILNSIAFADLIGVGSTVIDVGSGAGLPGIPLALRRPDLQVTLLEPMLRRTTFLEQAVTELELADRVTVTRARAEDHPGRTDPQTGRWTGYDVVTARAVAPLARLVQWCAPLIGPGGEMLALKGSSAASEIDQAQPVLAKSRLTADVAVVRADPRAEATQVVRIRRR